MTTKFGEFLPTGYLSLGDPYVKKRESHDKEDRAAFRPTGSVKKMKYNGFVALYSGEPYKNRSAPGSPSKAGGGTDGGVSPNPFRPGAPMKRSAGPGDYYGTLGGPVEHIAENPPVPRKRGDFQPGPPNIKTNPAKKGTYGYNKTTLSERAGAEGVAHEYRYLADPYCERKTKQLVEEKKDKHVSDNPFRPASGFKKYKPGMPGRTTGIPFPYIEEGPKKKEPLPPLERPFKPSHPTKTGINSTLDRFPPYIEDPIPAKIQAAKEARKREREMLGSLPPWRAGSGGPKTGATPSILRLNL